MKLYVVKHLLSFIVVLLAHQMIMGLLQAQPLVASIDAIQPPLVSIGTETELKLLGTNLQDLEQLIILPATNLSEIAQWRNPGDPPRVQLAGIRTSQVEMPPLLLDDVPQKNSGVFRIAVDPGTPPGVYELIAIGKYGASNPKSLLIVDSPVETVASNIPEGSVPECKVGVTYWGTMKAQGRHRLNIPPHEGALRIVCAASLLDSQSLPKLILKNSKGQTVRSHRSVGRYSSSVTYEGRNGLLLEVSDELYRGGDTFPFVLCLNPGPNHPLSDTNTHLPATVLTATGLPNSPVESINSRADVSIQTATEIQIPNGQSTVIHVQGEAKSVWECQVISNCLGHASDYRLVAYKQRNADGRMEGQLQLSEDTPGIGTKGVIAGHFDPTITVTTPEGSNGFFLLVQSVQSRANDLNQTVRLRIGPPIPRFGCLVHWTPWSNVPAQARVAGSVLHRGGKLPVHVTVLRQGGFQGPVEIGMESPSPGLTCPNVVIPAGQNEIDLLISASEDAAIWTGPVRFWSMAKIGETDIKQPVLAATIWRGFSTERGAPQSKMVSDLWLKVSEDLAPISVEVKSDTTLRAKAGEKLTIPITVKRRPGGEAKLILRPQNLPPKSSIPEGEVAPNADSATREISLSAETPPGVYYISFLAEMTWKLPVHPESHARHIAYRDRLQVKLGAEVDPARKSALETAIAEANKRIEQLAKDVVPRDFPTFFYTCDFPIIVEKP